MTDRLRRITSEMKESVNVLSSSASEILAARDTDCHGATETASAVSETTTTVEEVKQDGAGLQPEGEICVGDGTEDRASFPSREEVSGRKRFRAWTESGSRKMIVGRGA